MEFLKRKAAAMAAISDPSPDKSPKGTLDQPLLPLLNAINLHPSFFTTSSCSGRITILFHPHPDPSRQKPSKKKAGGGTWLIASHDPVDPEMVLGVLFGKEGRKSEGGGTLVFRFEPVIVAVECRDVEAARLLVRVAVDAGLRESGITSLHKRVMVAVRCSIRLEVPLGDVNELMVSPEYVRYLVGIANEKMEANRSRSDLFLQAFLNQISEKPIKVVGNRSESCEADQKDCAERNE